VGYAIREGLSDGIQEDLHATAVVLTDGTTKVAVIACDLTFLWSPYVDGVRERIAREIGTHKRDIVINCSHTHSAPMFPGFQQQEPEQEELQRRYYDNLREFWPVWSPGPTRSCGRSAWE
jgi:hypothetical protein